jgi:hypothetical protein
MRSRFLLLQSSFRSPDGLSGFLFEAVAREISGGFFVFA